MHNRTKMHYSRMRTTRCNCCLRGRGVCPVGGGVCLGGVSAQGGCLPRGCVCPAGLSARGRCLPRGVVSTWGGVCLGGCRPPPCEQNDWQTVVKTLPCPKLSLRTVKMLKMLEYCTHHKWDLILKSFKWLLCWYFITELDFFVATDLSTCPMLKIWSVVHREWIVVQYAIHATTVKG